MLGSIGNLQEMNPPTPDAAAWREFAIFPENDRWLAVTMGVSDPDMKSHLFASDDLEDWSHEGVFSDYGKGECLCIAEKDGRKVLFNLHYPDFDYQVGRFEDGSFRELAKGKSAVSSTRILAAVDADEEGSFQALWQMAGNHPFGSKEETRLGFSNTYSLPQTIEFRDDDSIRFSPHPAVAKLRREEEAFPGFVLENGEKMLPDAGGAHFEAELRAYPGGEGRCGLLLREGESEVRVGADFARQEYFLDLRQAPPDTVGAGSLLRRPFHPDDEGLHLRLFFDGSLVEAYANGTVLFDWILFANPDGVELGAFSERGNMEVEKLNTWQMDTIWKDLEE